MPKILVVDDNPAINTLLAQFIKEDGFETVQASNAQEAWQQLEQHTIDAIFLDIEMPEQTGVDFVFNLRRDEKYMDLPVVFVTAYPERSIPIQQSGKGAMKIISKPFFRKTIQEILTQLFPASE